VASSIHDYLVDQDGIDWTSALLGWAWLLPGEFTLWLVTRFADLILVLPDGSVHMLDVGAGTLERVANDRADFSKKIDEGDNANNWLKIPLVDECRAAGMRLKRGQCYGFKTPPVLGGEYSVENVGPLSITDYLGAYGSIHEQIRNLPDGAEVRLKVVD
jgi:hypothetical protein